MQMISTAMLATLLLVLLGPLSVSAQSLTLTPSAWTTIDTARIHLVQTPEGWLAFDFPVVPADPYAANDSTMNYLYTKRSRITATQQHNVVITMVAVPTSGAPVFNFRQTGNECTSPATARPFFWSDSGSKWGEFQRWWSNPTAYQLQAGGEHTVTVPLNPGAWSSVFGKRGDFDEASLAGFTEAIATMKHVGVTFGGGCFFGHGVNVSGGTARFILKSYAIERPQGELKYGRR
jgi:hypothetical protein